LVELVAP